MSMYKYLAEIYKKPIQNLGDIWKQRLMQFRREPAIIRLDKPTRLDRARSLGYKAKEGYVVVRVKLIRGGRMRPQFKAGRRSKHMRRKKIVGKSYQWIAEERASKKYPNCEVLNSYQIAVDGRHFWFEIILADRKQVSKYKGMEWLAEGKHQGRVFRGKTSAGRRSRGLRSNKGKGAEKIRPSLRANKRRAK
ncbi:MAG: 50S ribosomal protein L15e [Nanoarchaeota archaeon]|nr:50S ribosomal protein L15e [Nanoarchaeota archaeon]